MTAQKELYNSLWSSFHESGIQSQAKSRVSALVCTTRMAGSEDLQTVCFVVKGILMPQDDGAPFHRDPYGGVTTLRCLNSTRLAQLLDDHWKSQCKPDDKGRIKHGILNLESMEIVANQAYPQTLSELCGIVTLKIHEHKVHYKFVNDSKVSLISNKYLQQRLLDSIARFPYHTN